MCAHLSVCWGAGALWVSDIIQVSPEIHMVTSSSLQAADTNARRGETNDQGLNSNRE